MFVLKNLVVYLTHFYVQYKITNPFLKRNTLKPEFKKSIFTLLKILRKLMDCTNVFCVIAVLLHAQKYHPDNYLGQAVLI